VTGQTIRLGIPKGSLEEATLAIFHKGGFQFTGSSRSLWLSSNDPEIVPVLLRPQEIPVYVQSGRLDAGLAGLDWIVERDVEDQVALLAELQYSKQTSRPIRWVLAVPDQMPVTNVDDLRALCEERGIRGEGQFTISTELTRVSNLWLARNGIDAYAEFSWGATEAKAGYFADAVIEATETGSSLRANGLRILADVFTSRTQFFANKSAYRLDPWKRQKLDGIAHLLIGALRADELVQMTVVGDHVLDLEEILPPDARIVTAVGPTGLSPFHALLILRKSSVPHVLPAVIACGASDAWVSALDIHYSRSASKTSPSKVLPEVTQATGLSSKPISRLVIERLDVGQPNPVSLATEAQRGLGKSPKELPTKYLYAADGSDIFEKITQLPEYYVTRAEIAALESAAREIITRGSWSQLIELGPGSGQKTRYLLEPMLLRADVTYKPIDLSEDGLRSLAEPLVREYRGLTVHGYVGDFLESSLSPALEDDAPKLLAFLGSTLGNLTPSQRQALYERFARSASPQDGFLIGIDLVKDPAIIEAAYNDAAGVTADFNMNVLRTLQHDVGAKLDLDDFHHKAVYVQSEHCVEMRLYASRDAAISFEDEQLPSYSIAAGDYILTELSYKFTREGLESEFSSAGLRLLGWWTDRSDQVALALVGLPA
jgi:dimethylhistidine N-methyltransferase/ATP phosphoribosyltransferase